MTDVVATLGHSLLTPKGTIPREEFHDERECMTKQEAMDERKINPPGDARIPLYDEWTKGDKEHDDDETPAQGTPPVEA